MFKRIKHITSATFLLNFLVSAILYFPSLHAKFIYDINAHFITYERLGWRGFFTDWGEKTIRWGIHTVNFLIWYVFGHNDVAWFAITIAFHAMTATLLFTLLYKIFDRAALKHGIHMALSAMILFLISPYHSETIVWGATLFYITFSAAFLGMLHAFVKFTESNNNRYIALFYILYLFTIVTFEEFMIIPLILLIFYLLFCRLHIFSISARKFYTIFFVPSIALIFLFFLWNKWLLGKWIGHYGADVHFNADIFLLSSNFTKYLLKYSYLHLFLSYGQRDKIYEHLNHHKVLLAQIFTYIGLGIACVYLLFSRSVADRWKVLSALFALFVVALLPVLNLLWPYNKDIEQERYLYVASLFFYSFLSVLFFSIFRKASFVLIGSMVCISLFFLNRNMMCWHEVGRINNNLSATFRWQNAKRIFILLNADNYGGAYQMRDMPESAFAEILRVQRHIDIAPNSYDILQFNMNLPQDSCYHEIVDSTTLKITFAQWGNWFWYKSYGAASYDSTLYKVTIDNWNHSFTARFKDKRPGDVYIYQAKDHWVEISGF